MRTYALKRGLAAIIVLIIVSVLVFTLMHLLPGDTLLAKLGQTGRIPEAQMAELRHKIGIDDPLYVQYFRWVGHIFDGTMDESLIYEGQTVSSRIGNSLPVTLELGVLSMVAAVVLGVPLGILSATQQDKPLDYLIRIIALTGLSVPQFFIGIAVLIYGTLYLGYAPPRHYVELWDDPIANLKQMWVPVLILAYGLAAGTMRMMRSTVLEAMHDDYVRTARAKGVTERAVIYGHIMRNSLIPVITLLGNQAAFVFSGALIIEVLFGFPGMGKVTYQAIQQRDYTQVQGCALVAGGIVVFINLVIDLSYGWLDPRVRYS